MLHSQTVEYAMRATVYLGARHGRGSSAKAIAAETGIPAAYSAKILKDLARAGLLRSRRGRHGGFSLDMPPSEISLLDVVNAVAPLERIRSCPLGHPEHQEALCPLHGRLDASIARMEEDLAGCTIAELLAAPIAQRPYCGFPSPRPAEPQAGTERGKMETAAAGSTPPTSTGADT